MGNQILGKRPSLLIVDDELDNFDVLETLLMREGYDLRYAPNGKTALTCLENSPPDAVLLDVMMPEMDGIEVCRRIKASPVWNHLPVIMVTALTAKEDLARCLDAGADDFISKPVNAQELRARIRSMLRIKQQHDNLQSVMQLREDMVNMMVHDLRTPLAIILMAAFIMKMPDRTPDEMDKNIDRIEQAGYQLQSQIDSLLLMAKLESGTMTLNRTSIDLQTLCMEAVDEFEGIASQRQVTLRVKLPPVGSFVTVDANIFRRIVDNLLSNAIKFSRLDSEVILEAEYLGADKAIIRVKDSGFGVNTAVKQSIFEKFEIGTFLENVPQIGLGLAFCRMAIEAHGGHITVEDNVPQGAIFSVYL